MSTATLGGTRPNKAVVNTCGGAYHKFTNDSGGALVEGQEVYLKPDGTIGKRVDGSTRLLGIVYKGGADTELVTVQVNCFAVVYGLQKAAANAGVHCVPDGTLHTDGVLPKYEAATSGEVAWAIQLTVTTGSNEVAKYAMLHTPVTV